MTGSCFKLIRGGLNVKGSCPKSTEYGSNLVEVVKVTCSVSKMIRSCHYVTGIGYINVHGSCPSPNLAFETYFTI